MTDIEHENEDLKDEILILMDFLYEEELMERYKSFYKFHNKGTRYE